MSTFIDAFQDMRTILCVCPCCGELVRASDLHLSAHGKAPKTWLDTYEEQVGKLALEKEKFQQQEKEIRAKATERGRIKVVEKVCSCLDPCITKHNYNPYDIKPIFHPVDFVVFNGLNTEDEIKDITFLSRTRRGDQLQKSVHNVVKDGRYSWKVARVTDDGGVVYK